MKSNVRFKRADIVRTRAKYVYTRIMDRTVNDPNPLTQDALLTGDAQGRLLYQQLQATHGAVMACLTAVTAKC